MGDRHVRFKLLRQAMFGFHITLPKIHPVHELVLPELVDALVRRIRRVALDVY